MKTGLLKTPASFDQIMLIQDIKLLLETHGIINVYFSLASIMANQATDKFWLEDNKIEHKILTNIAKQTHNIADNLTLVEELDNLQTEKAPEKPEPYQVKPIDVFD